MSSTALKTEITRRYGCVVVNMVDRCVAVRGDEIIGEMPITARGRTG